MTLPTSSPPEWRLLDQGQGEGEARLLETDGHHAVVQSTLPFAAGSTLLAVDPASQTKYQIKVRGGRRIDDRWFRIEGRVVTLTKPEREHLLALLAGTRATSSRPSTDS
jgi:hypothetical protein